MLWVVLNIGFVHVVVLRAGESSVVRERHGKTRKITSRHRMSVELKQKGNWQVFLWMLGRISSKAKYAGSKHLIQLSKMVDSEVLLLGRTMGCS